MKNPIYLKLADKEVCAFFALTFLSLAIGLIIIWSHPPIGDESAHSLQILQLSQGNFLLLEETTTIPGYHALQAVITFPFRAALPVQRLVNAAISLAALCLFYLLSKLYKHERTLSYLLLYLPIAFPLYFMVYTDILSLFLVLLCLLFFSIQKYAYSGLAGLLSVGVRQNNIIWVCFVLALLYIRQRNIKQTLAKGWSYLISISAFTIFAIANKGFSLGDKTIHPTMHFSLGNIYFLLFLFFFLFLPYAPVFIKRIRLMPAARILAISTSLFAIFLLTFTASHPYNQAFYSFYLRNQILLFFSSNLLTKALFFIPVLFSVLALSLTKLKKPEFALIYPFTIIYLLPSWLVEQRYYIIPFTLFLLFRNTDEEGLGQVQVVYFATISILLFIGTAADAFIF